MSDFRLDIAQLDILTLDGAPAVSPVPSDVIYYENFGLQNANIVTQFVRVSPAQLALAERGFPRADGEYAETAYFLRTLITLQGVVQGATQQAMETTMDLLAKAFAKKGGVFMNTFAGDQRFYDQCYPVNIETLFDTRDHYHVTWCPFSIQLVCLQPYSRSATRLSSTLDNMTVSPTVYTLPNSGDAPTAPMIFMTVSVAGSLSQLVFTNLQTSEALTLAATFHDGDTINIDGEKKLVQINGVNVDYSGVIPSLAAGTNQLSIAATGAGYTIAFGEQHYFRFFN